MIEKDGNMRVLHIFSSPHLTHGASIFEYRISGLLKKDGIFFDYLVTERETEEEAARYKEQGSRIYHLKIDNAHGLFMRELKANRAYYRFFKEHKKQFKIVYADTENSLRAVHLLMARIAGIPVRVVHSHNNNLQTQSSFSRRFSRIIRKIFRISATDYFACSDVAAEWLFPRKIYRKKQYRLINNGIDTELFAFNGEYREEIRDMLGIAGGTLVVGAVARFMEQKNHMFMLDIMHKALEYNPDMVLLLIGEGKLEDQVKERAAGLGIGSRVIFAGTSPYVYKYLSAMDVYLMPSLFEGLGIAALEAQANGLACLVSENVPKEVKMCGSVVFKSLDEGVDEWAKELIRLSKLRSGGEQARANMTDKGYAVEHTADILRKFYKSKEKLYAEDYNGNR